jgi:hypothetical protein
MRGVVDNVCVYESRLDLCATFPTIHLQSFRRFMCLFRGCFLIRDTVTLLTSREFIFGNRTIPADLLGKLSGLS